jgi:hypothetical protein
MSTTTTAAPTTTCIDIEPGKHGYLPPEACDVVLPYVPSFAAAVLFCVLFGLTMLAHIIQGYVFRKVRIHNPPTIIEDYPSNINQGFCWVVAMGALWELAAFIFRVLLTRNQSTESYSALFSLLMLLAPLCKPAPIH